jgi:FtsP/CotA-like multicopper oxidase with cupredoxin domain
VPATRRPRPPPPPRRYRLRFLNGSNARFYQLSLARTFAPVDEAAGTGVRVTRTGPVFWQIGTDGGLLDAPVPLDTLVVAPGERADVIVDFSGLEQGTRITMVNNANSPFPDGDPVATATTGQVMQFRVSRRTSSHDRSCDPARGACRLRPGAPMVRLADAATGRLAPGVSPSVTRQLILEEIAVESGPREVVLNNTLWPGVKESTLTSSSQVPVPGSVGLGGNWATEAPQVGATEVWEVANLTVDAHPIHVHLIQFQVLGRQALDTGEDDAGNPVGYLAAWQAAFPGGAVAEGDGPPRPYGTPNADGALGGNLPFSDFLVGAPRPPDAGEAGWKDTVIMRPGEVTRLVARWAPQAVPVGGVQPGTNRYPFDPSLTDPGSRDLFGNPGAAGYLWHCHILEHEDNEMMRPYAVAR